MPLPPTYTDRATWGKEGPVATSELDRPRAQNVVHLFERTALAAFPFLVGAMIATTLLSLAALLTGLVTLPALIRYLGLEPRLGKYAHLLGGQTAGANSTQWEQYSPLSPTSTGLLGKYGWALPILLLNLGMAYMTLFGQAKKPVNVVAVEQEVVAVPVPVKVVPAVRAAPAAPQFGLGRQL
jgi:hypothetical protein